MSGNKRIWSGNQTKNLQLNNSEFVCYLLPSCGADNLLFSQQAYLILTASAFATCLVRDMHKKYVITIRTHTINNVNNFQQPFLLRYYMYVKDENLNSLFLSEFSSVTTVSILLTFFYIIRDGHICNWSRSLSHL